LSAALLSAQPELATIGTRLLSSLLIEQKPGCPASLCTQSLLCKDTFPTGVLWQTCLCVLAFCCAISKAIYKEYIQQIFADNFRSSANGLTTNQLPQTGSAQLQVTNVSISLTEQPPGKIQPAHISFDVFPLGTKFHFRTLNNIGKYMSALEGPTIN